MIIIVWMSDVCSSVLGTPGARFGTIVPLAERSCQRHCAKWPIRAHHRRVNTEGYPRPPLAAVRLPQSLNRKEYQMIEIRAQLRRQTELEEEQRAPGQSRNNSRNVPWRSEERRVGKKGEL